MLFIDHDGSVTISNGRRSIRLTRQQFQTLEPRYQPDGSVITRHLDAETYWISDGANQQPATDIPRETIEGYIERLQIYRQQVSDPDPPAPPPQPPEQPEENWAGLEGELRNSPVWARAFDAASRSVRANAAFTLVLTTLTTTHSLTDLRFGWEQLRDCMREQASLSDFGVEELEFVRQALTLCHFDPAGFDLEVS